MEVNAVTAPVMSNLVIYAAASQAPTRTALVITDCEETHSMPWATVTPVTSPVM